MRRRQPGYWLYATLWKKHLFIEFWLEKGRSVGSRRDRREERLKTGWRGEESLEKRG